MSTPNYRDLKVWQKSMKLVSAIYMLTKKLPESERFVLTSQLQRAAISVPSNIAEGRGRGTDKEFIRFIHITLGSLAEIDTQLELAVRLGYCQQKDILEMATEVLEIRKMLFALKRALTR